MNRLTTSVISLMLLGVLMLVSVGCASSQEIDRTKRRPHTSMRGPAYKTLILTYNEAYHLAYRADRYAKALRDAGTVDDATIQDARTLAEDLAGFADDVEWSLANTQRMNGHRGEMNRYWDRFLDLYPDDVAYQEAYTDDGMRKATRKLALKNQDEYRQLHEFEHQDTNWSILLKPIGVKVYKDQVEKQDQ